MIYALAATSAVAFAALFALLYVVRSTSQERRILWASTLEAAGKADAARRASGPTHQEAQASVDQQLAIMKEAKENNGVFSAENPFANAKPLGI